MESAWVPAWAAADRSHFLPPRMWPVVPARGAVQVDRYAGRPRWLRYADADVPIVTHWNGGGAEDGVPACVAAAPGMVMAALRDLDVESGSRVLEVGTGTGWTAGLLTHRLGPERVVTVDVDTRVVDRAQRRLAEARLFPAVLERDVLEGEPTCAPYDRIIASVEMRTIPAAWIEQARPEAIILAPYATTYGNQAALVKLVVGSDGQSASGRFLRTVGVMTSARGRWGRPRHTDYVQRAWPRTMRQSTTDLDPADLTGGPDAAVPFVLGLLLPDVAHTAYRRKGDGQLSIWLYSLADRSWATATWPGVGEPGTVRQDGARSLWTEVESALAWWAAEERPGVECFGLTVDTEGTHTVWLDDPHHPLTSTG